MFIKVSNKYFYEKPNNGKSQTFQKLTTTFNCTAHKMYSNH